MYNIILGIQFIGVILSVISVIFIFNQQPSKNQNILLAASICIFFSIISNFYEIQARSLDEALIAIKFGYMGKIYSSFLFLVFAIFYCNYKSKLFATRFIVFLQSFITCLILTCENHDLYYKNIGFENEGLYPHIVFTPGIFYYVNMALFVLILVCYVLVLSSKLVGCKSENRKNYIYLIWSGIVPMVLLMMYLVGIFRKFDPTSIGLIFASWTIMYNVLHYGLLDTMSLAQKSMTANIKEGVIVVDGDYKLSYTNNSVKKIFGELSQPRSKECDKLIKEVFYLKRNIIEREDIYYEVNVVDLCENNFVRGYLAFTSEKCDVSDYVKLKETLVGVNSDNMPVLVTERKNNKKYDTSDLLLEIIKYLDENIDNDKIDVKTFFDDKIPTALYGDYDKVLEVVRLLISEAKHYTKTGNISVFLYVSEKREKEVFLELHVKDTGRGIDKKDEQKIYELIKDSKSDNILSQMGSLVRKLNGKVKFSSDYGVGTNFIVTFGQKIVNYLPIGETFTDKTGLNLNCNKYIAPKLTMLLFGADELSILILKRVLEIYEIKPDVAINFDIGIQMAKEKKYNVIILDYDSITNEQNRFIEKVKSDVNSGYYDITFIALISSKNSVNSEELEKYGYSYFLVNPIDLNLLEDILADCIPEEYIEFTNKI